MDVGFSVSIRYVFHHKSVYVYFLGTLIFNNEKLKMCISVCYINIDILSVPISDWIMRIISLPLKVFFKY